MDKIIYLTFDDGPLEPYTSRILDSLDRWEAKATFFVCGKNIERNTESLRRIAERGHAIGNHTYSHNFSKVIGGRLKNEIQKTSELIQNITGTPVRLYRSPWGITMPWVRGYLQRNGYKHYHWNIMAHDWLQPSAQYISGHIVKRAFPGAIVLLHDGDQVTQGSREQTAAAVDIILEQLTGQGYVFKALDGSHDNSAGLVKNLIIDNHAWITRKV